jgi:hypothetical protein
MTAASRLPRAMLATGVVAAPRLARASRRRCIWPSRGCSEEGSAAVTRHPGSPRAFAFRVGEHLGAFWKDHVR